MATRRKLRKSGKSSRKHQRTFKRKNRVKRNSKKRRRVMRGGSDEEEIMGTLIYKSMIEEFPNTYSTDPGYNIYNDQIHFVFLSFLTNINYRQQQTITDNELKKKFNIYYKENSKWIDPLSSNFRTNINVQILNFLKPE